MLQNTRRNFLLASAAAALAGISRRTAGAETLTPRATSLTSGEPYARQAFEPQTCNVAWKLGMIIGVGNDPEKALATVHRLVCRPVSWKCQPSRPNLPSDCGKPWIATGLLPPLWSRVARVRTFTTFTRGRSLAAWCPARPARLASRD